MRVLIVTEKPSCSAAVAAAVQRAKPWPGAEVLIVPTYGFGLFRFAWPEGLRSADFPHVSAPAKELGGRAGHGWEDPQAWWGICGDRPEPPTGRPGSPAAHGFQPDHRFSAAPAAFVGVMGAIARSVEGADLILRMTDADPRGAVAFDDFLTCGGTRGGGRGVAYDCAPWSLADAEVDAALLAAAEGSAPRWDAGNPGLLRGRAKEFFDYNWALNGAALLAAPLRAVGVGGLVDLSGGRRLPASQCLGKYALLMLLHLCRDGGPEREEGGLIAEMGARWAGTGRYPAGSAKVGSPSSQHAILDNLVRLGLAEQGDAAALRRGPARPFRPTPAGRRLSELLPKSAYDPDLPFRLDAWSRAWPASRPAMEAYLRRFFGNIKRASGAAALVPCHLSALEAARGLVGSGLAPAEAAALAQVSATSVAAALAGGAVTPGEARALALALLRVVRGETGR